MATPESPVKRATKRAYDELGAWSYAPVQNGMGVVGIPDRIGCVPVTITPEMVGKQIGVFVAIECKAPGKLRTVTANQQRNLDGIRDAKGVALALDTPDAEAVKDAVIEALHG